MALSANRNLTVKNLDGMTRYTAVVQTSAKIYRHALVEVSTSTGFARPCADSTTGVFLGLAEEECDTGDGTTVEVTVVNNIDVLLPLITAITRGNTMVTILHAADDETATTATTLGPAIGVMTEFEETNSGWVRLRQHTTAAAS